MQRNDRTITGLETPLKKVLYGKLEKYILIGSMINIRKLFTNNLVEDVLIHSDTKMHSEGGTKKYIFAEDGGEQFSKLVNFATRNLRQPQTQLETRLAARRPADGVRRLHGLREQTKNAANAVHRTACGVWRGESVTSTYISCLRNFQQDISSYQFGG